MIKIELTEKRGILRGELNVRVMDLVREMPGRKKWKDRDLIFEPTEANISYLKKAFPDAEWQDPVARLAEIEQLRQLESDSRSRKRDPLPIDPINFPFKTKPYDHQTRIFHWGKDRDYLALFAEMGCGKSKSWIDLLAYWYSIGAIDGCLLWAPNGVHRQWVSEQMPTHAPDFMRPLCHAYTSGKKIPKELLRQDGVSFRFMAQNIESMSHVSGYNAAAEFLRSGRMAVGVDESVVIKTPGAERTKNVMKLRPLAVKAGIMSGAPVTKGLEDLYAQMKFLDEDILGFSSYYTFRNRYCDIAPAYRGAPKGVIKIVGYYHVQEFTSKIDAHSFRITKEECLDLPPKIYDERIVEMTEEQKRLYRELKKELFVEVKDGKIVHLKNAMTKLVRLQQITSGYIPDDDGVKIAIPHNRIKALMEIMEQAPGKVGIWARFTEDINQICAALKKKGIGHVRYDGLDTDPVRREAAKQRFLSDPDCIAFVGNPAAAARGLNLQVASICVYYTNSFDADHRWQSEDRFHRSGMTGPVTYIDLIAPGSVDRRILQALKNKEKIADSILDDPDSWVEVLKEAA